MEAYIEALNQLLAEEHWAGATDEAGNFRAAATETGPRTEFDPTPASSTRSWFDR